METKHSWLSRVLKESNPNVPNRQRMKKPHTINIPAVPERGSSGEILSPDEIIIHSFSISYSAVFGGW
jgi:hypothetical protein